jgi:murein L,D-transpeptidase YcbB/YkuD
MNLSRNEYKSLMVVSGLVGAITLVNLYTTGDMYILVNYISGNTQTANVVESAEFLDEQTISVEVVNEPIIAVASTTVVNDPELIAPPTVVTSVQQVESVQRSEPVFTEVLVYGSEGQQVIELQRLLSTMEDIYPEREITGTYGSLTQRAVKLFQLKYGIADEDSPYFGTVGPATREKLNELRARVI